MQHLGVEDIRLAVEGWRSEAQMETYDAAYDPIDLEWLGGRIGALNDVLTLLDSKKHPRQCLRLRLLGDVLHSTRDGCLSRPD